MSMFEELYQLALGATLTLTISAPLRESRRAAFLPALPNPSIATVIRSTARRSRPPFVSRVSSVMTAPTAMASGRSSEPQTSTGLRVTTPSLGVTHSQV